jgi:hypothetical protein
MSMPSDVAEYLEDNSIGTVGTDIFIQFTPETPHNAISVFQYSGWPPLTVAGFTRPGLQVKVRNTNAATAITKMEAIIALLHDKGELTLEGTRYPYIEMAQTWFPLGWEEVVGGRRFTVACNFNVVMA